MLKFNALAVISGFVLIAASTGNSQIIQQGPDGWQLAGQQPTQSLPTMRTQVQNPYPAHSGPQQTMGNTWRSERPIYHSQPQLVTTDQLSYVDQWGNVHTKNEQVNNTYFDPNRETSKSNGTYRFVRRPVYGANGQIAGYEEGYVWNNSITGQEHGQLKTVTQKGGGGTHEQHRLQRAGGSHTQHRIQSATPPGGSHTQYRLQGVGRR
jgi:hypothetical protein